MKLEDRLDNCRKALDDTLNNLRTLQSRHQQLIGYQQALIDLLNDEEKEKEVVDAFNSYELPKKSAKETKNKPSVPEPIVTEIGAA